MIRKVTCVAWGLTGWFIVGAVCVSAQPTGYWFKRPDLPTPRQEMPAVYLNGKIYVMGGILQNRVITTINEVYDPATATWDTAAPLPWPRHHFSCTEVNGKLYAVGGYESDFQPWIPTDNVFEYDPSSDSWSNKAPLPTQRGEHVAVAFGGKIYVIGGYGVMSTEIYDPASNTWSTGASLNILRNHLSGGAIDSLIYTVGGRDDNLVNTSMLLAYSPVSDNWYAFSPMPTARSGLAAAVLGGKLYAFGGEIPALHDEVEEYTPTTDSWRQLPDMLTPRHGMHAVTVGDTVFIIGGAEVQGYGVSDANDGFVLGTCLDTDYDSFGDPAQVGSTCPPDNCPGIYNPLQEDADADSVGNVCDNCPSDYNPDQLDSDGVPPADACGGCPVAMTGDVTRNGIINSSDIIALVNYVFKGGAEPVPCAIVGDVNCSGSINSADIIYIVNYVFKGGAAPCDACMTWPGTWECP